MDSGIARNVAMRWLAAEAAHDALELDIGRCSAAGSIAQALWVHAEALKHNQARCKAASMRRRAEKLQRIVAAGAAYILSGKV